MWLSKVLSFSFSGWRDGGVGFGEPSFATLQHAAAGGRRGAESAPIRARLRPCHCQPPPSRLELHDRGAEKSMRLLTPQGKPQYISANKTDIKP